jgi:multiple sugar transport system substrate-binding protein
MREKHFRLFLLVCAAAAFLLTAAGAFAGGAKESTSGAAPSSTAVKQLSLWDFHGAAEGEFFKSLPDLYAQVNPNVKITVETVPWDDYLGTKLEAAFAAGAGPDLFFVSPGTIGKYINSGIAYPLNAFMTSTIVSDFSPSSIKGVSIGDKIYAIPFEIELVGLYYDADVLAAAGVQPPATWDDLKAAALKLKTDKRAGITIEVSKGAYQTYTWYPFLWQTGADVFTPDLKHSALDNPGVAKALQLWKDLIDSGAANLRPSRSTTDIGILGDGETAMQICGSWAIPTIENQYKDKNIKVVRLPIPEGGKPADVAGGWKFMVNAKGKYPEEAAKFAVWAFGTNIDLPLKWTTVVKFAYSPRKSVMAAGQSIFTKGLRAVFTKDIYGTEKPEIRMPAEASSILEDMIQNAMFNKDYDGAKAAMEANQRMEAFLKSYPGQI